MVLIKNRQNPGGGGLMKNQYKGEGLPKKGELGQFADLGVGLGKKEGVVLVREFEGMVIPQCTL